MVEVDERIQEQAPRPQEVLLSLWRVGWTRFLILSLGINVLLAELLLVTLPDAMRSSLELAPGFYLLGMVEIGRAHV